jgi:HupH hydrogenase expression protein, C-terminal conserved region
MSDSSNSARDALRSIGVQVELCSGNQEPLLHEIRHALAALLDEGRGTCIDLKGIPLAPGEEERILARLGKGELRAELTAFGTSEILETAFSGVWVISHFDTQGALLGRFVEVTRIPEIVCSQTADIAAGLAQLTSLLHARADLTNTTRVTDDA